MKYVGLAKSSYAAIASSRYTCRNCDLNNSDKYRPVSSHSYSFFFVLFISLFLFYSSVCADEQPQFYTIQAGSYAGEQGALHLYQNLAEILPESQRSSLRVERVGSYYTVRVGKFANRDAAKGFFAQTEQYLPNAMILQAYIKQERILRVYQPVTEIDLALETEQAAAFAEQESSGPAELPLKETGVTSEVAMETDVPAPELTSDAPVSNQNTSASKTGEKQQTAVIDEPLQRKERIAQISAGEERSAVVTETNVNLSQQSVIPAEPEKVGVEEGYGEAEGFESLSTVDQQGLTEKVDKSMQAQKEGFSDETDAENAFADEVEVNYERLGQPAGLSNVRVVAILKKTIFGGDYRYPTTVHYDPIMNEIFVIGGGGSHPSASIMIYGPDYFPVASLGVGRGVGAPKGIDLDAEGNLYITQAGCQNKGGCLMVLNPAFFKIAEVFFNDIEEVPDEFRPLSVAVSQEYIYLTAESTGGVLVLDRDYNFKRWLVPMKVGVSEQVGDDLEHLNAQTTRDVVVDRKGRIYMLCPDQGRIFVLDAEWNFLFAFGTKGGSTAKLSRAKSLAVDVDREVIYVVDYMRHGILLYDYNDGAYLFEIGGHGLKPGWFNFPSHVEVDGRGNLIVADYFNNRVQVLLVP